MRSLLPGLAASVGVLTAHAASQVQQVIDINGQTTTPISSAPQDFVVCGGRVVFTAFDADHGREIWASDGAGQRAVLLADIAPGSAESYTHTLTPVRLGGRDQVLFGATDADGGSEPWITDGTPAGTRRLKDVVPGTGSSSPQYFCAVGARAFFQAGDGAHGRELWTTDGTEAGTRLVADIVPGPGESLPVELTAGPTGDLLFVATTPAAGAELWRSDGTAAGTALVLDLEPGPLSPRPQRLRVLGAHLLFVAGTANEGFELWRTDGTAAGTSRVADIEPGVFSSWPALHFAVQLGPHLFFAASTLAQGTELWRTDGTPAGTSLVRDIRAGAEHSYASPLVAVAGVCYLSADDGSNGRELWRSDGTAAGTFLVRDLAPGPASSDAVDAVPFGPASFLFSAATGARTLWLSDGTASGTQPVNSAAGNPRSLTSLGQSGPVLFAADSGTGQQIDRELWSTSGTSATTSLLADIEPRLRTLGSEPASLACDSGDRLFCGALVAAAGREPWVIEGRSARLLLDIRPGPQSSLSSASRFVPAWVIDGAGVGRQLTFFAAHDDTFGRELWRTDGTPAGTTRVADIARGTAASDPRELLACNGALLFAADGASGRELYRSDGTAAGTRLLADLAPGTASSAPDRLFWWRGHVLLRARTDAEGHELWLTDGTTAGTRLLADLVAGPGGSDPDSFCAFGDRFVFVATTIAHGRELWISDGTSAGTRIVADLLAGSFGSGPVEPVVFGGRVFFAANTFSGVDLWATDGTTGGTTRIKDLPPTSAQGVRELTVAGDRLFFVAPAQDAQGQAIGDELWVSDGTDAGTRVVVDLAPGPGSSSPRALTASGRHVFFAATPNTPEQQLWVSDGTAAGTRRQCFFGFQRSPNSLDQILACEGAIWFRDDHPSFGSEVIRLPTRDAQARSIGAPSLPLVPTLDATPPVLGAPLTITGLAAHPGGIGVALLGLPLPQPVQVPASGSAWLDPTGSIVLAARVGTTLAVTVPVPPANELRGGVVLAQAWWLHPVSGVPISTSNGMRLLLGD